MANGDRTSSQALDDEDDRRLFLRYELSGGLEREREPCVFGSAILAENQFVSRDRQRHRQPPERLKARLHTARLVASELGDVNGGPVRELLLRQAPGATGHKQALGELHAADFTERGLYERFFALL